MRMAVTQDFDSERCISAATQPLLFLHGTADSIVPHSMSDHPYAAARQVPQQYKRIIKIDGASHRGALAMAASDYGDALRQFAQLTAARLATSMRLNLGPGVSSGDSGNGSGDNSGTRMSAGMSSATSSMSSIAASAGAISLPPALAGSAAAAPLLH
jgi:hypothetical protein